MSAKKKAVIGVVAVVIIAAALFFLWTMTSASGATAALPVETEMARRDTIVTSVSAKGEVSLQNSQLIYSNMAAEVAEVLVEKNDEVIEGQPIIRFKESTREALENDLKNARLNVESARLALAEAREPAAASEIESARLAVVSAEGVLSSAQNELEQLEAQISQQRRKVEEAETSLSKIKVLYQSGGASQNEVDQAEAAAADLRDALDTYLAQRTQRESAISAAEDDISYRSLLYQDVQNRQSSSSSQNTIALRQIQLEQYELVVERLQSELEDFQQEIYSPISGMVIDVNVSRGEVASTDKALMEIADVEDYVVKVNVSERNASKIVVGQEVHIEGSVLGDNLVMGSVSKIGYIAETSVSGTSSEIVVPVEITVEGGGAAGFLKPGFTLEADIITDTRVGVVIVPILSTLSNSDGSSYVFVIREDNTLEKRAVELGAYADMTVEVTGLEDGEVIVAQPTIDMTEGMAVLPISAEDEAEETETESGSDAL